MTRASHIRYMLTLRYDPFRSSSLPSLDWTSWVEYLDIANSIQPLLENTIRRAIAQMKPKRVGMGISGGVDSTVTLALTRKSFPGLPIKSYCITFGGDLKEAGDAAHVAELYHSDHRHVNIPDPFENLDEQVEILGEPRWNGYNYYLFKIAAQDGCDLLLTGEGGDELFGGYSFRYSRMVKSQAIDPVADYMASHERDWVPDQERLFKDGFSWGEVRQLLSSYFDNPLSLLGQVFLADYNGKLRFDFAPTSDAFSKHFQVKTFATFLQPEVLHVAAHLPYSLKYDQVNNLGKVLLRRILLENSGYRPATKGKVGWTMDLAEMWDNYVRGRCKQLFLSETPRCVEEGIINAGWFPNAFDKCEQHDLRYISKMLGLLALELWLGKSQV